jgi:hypothetical protein
MTVPDIATNTYNYNFGVAPITRSLLNTDFYKTADAANDAQGSPGYTGHFCALQELPDKMN